MKRDSTCNVSIATEHPLMCEEANLKATYRPGADGGTYGLPLGAKLVLGEGVCGKKDWITCQVVSPADRWRHNPSFPGEHVTSEIFTLSGSVLKQRTAVLVLPYYPPPGKHVQLAAKVTWAGTDSWQEVPFVVKTDTPQPCVEVEVDRPGTFLLTFRPKTDLLHLSSQGGLCHSRLNRNISVRFPKRAVDCALTYSLQIVPVPEDCLPLCKDYFPTSCCDLLHVSEFVHMNPSDLTCNFRRCATIKLPLPEGVTTEEGSANQIVVLHKENDSWQWLDTKYKFSRNTVTFDVRNPNKLCVVQCSANRERKMQEAVEVVERRVNRVQAEIALFLSLQKKSWQAVLEYYPVQQATHKLATRRDQGFTVYHRVQPPPDPAPAAPFSSRRPPPVVPRAAKVLDGLETFDGLTWTLEVTGDLGPASSSDVSATAGVQCFHHLRDSYRQVALRPACDEERALQGTITLRPQDIDDPDLRAALTFLFHLEIPEQAVKDFLFVPPPPQPLPDPKVKGKDARGDSGPQPRVPAAPKKRVFHFTQTPMERLTQLPRRYNVPEREARVLSGRSLMTLAKMLDNGVALAIQLGLKESTVSGIGFDTMSGARSLTDMTYKILLYWKRTCKQKNEGAVQELVGALQQLGKGSVGQVVLDSHHRNKELTMDCFLQAVKAGVDLST
ncbi:uncharacterized protein LOC143277498 [Babylonia areolata]|uniref:uncharacterized protein LOC143277498 n=1 Tax=Babylonia areolata TaxID=304850 RepID=UPI003FD61652